MTPGFGAYTAAAVRFWRGDGSPQWSRLAAGSEQACQDVARRASAGTREWPAVAVLDDAGTVCCWWVAGQLAEPPEPPARPSLSPPRRRLSAPAGRVLLLAVIVAVILLAVLR